MFFQLHISPTKWERNLETSEAWVRFFLLLTNWLVSGQKIYNFWQSFQYLSCLSRTKCQNTHFLYRISLSYSTECPCSHTGLHGTAVSDHCTDDEDDDDVIVDIITNGPNVPAQPRIVSLASVHWFAPRGAEAQPGSIALIHVNAAFQHLATHQLFPVCKPAFSILHSRHLAGTLIQSELAWMEQ